MIEVFWTPPHPEVSAPVIPGYSEDGRQQFFRGAVEGVQVSYRLPDTTLNRRVVKALPPSFSSQPDERLQLMERLRALGVPHRKNERLETLIKKVPRDALADCQLD